MTTQPQLPRTAFKRVGSYDLEEEIGCGSFATVWKGKNFETNVPVAIKLINLRRLKFKNPKHQSNLKSEIDILASCRHKNIVELLATHQTTNNLYLIMQYCGGGDLQNYFIKNGKINEKHSQIFSIQLLNGLKYLHSLNIIHRDLKPQNILLSCNTHNAILRIADFGFARYKPNQSSLAAMQMTICGSPLYMAPEILQCNTKYDSRVDLWSLGTILYQMINGKPPFNGRHTGELLLNIQKTKQLKFYSKDLSYNCCHLISSLLQQNPQKRISWNNFFNHPWFIIKIKKKKKKNKIKTIKTDKISPKTVKTLKTSPKISPKTVKIDYNFFVNKFQIRYNEILIEYKYAHLVMQVGNIRVINDDISSSLLLYLRGLDIFENIIKISESFISIYNKNQNQNNKNNDNIIDKYVGLCCDSINGYKDYLKRIEAIQTLCETQHLQFNSNKININKIIFYYSINCAKKYASDIILNIETNNNDINNGTNKINESKLLLQYLMKLDDVTIDDKKQINEYLIAIDNTLKAVERLKNQS